MGVALAAPLAQQPPPTGLPVRSRSVRSRQPVAQLLDDRSSLVAGVEVTNLRGDFRASDSSLLEVLTSGLKDRLRPHGSGSPMKPLLEVLVEKNDDRDSPTAMGEVAINQLRVLIAQDYPDLTISRLLEQLDTILNNLS